MKSILSTLVILILSNSTQALVNGSSQDTSCSSMRWMVSIHSPASGKEMAAFFQTIATDQFQPVLKIHRLKANADESQDYSVNLLVEFQFENVGLYTFDEAKGMAVQAIDDLKKISNTKVFCDSLSGGGGHLSGSN